MSRTYKDRNNQRRFIKNAMLKKVLRLYSEDIVGKRKNRKLNKVLRHRLKKETNEEFHNYY